jgi:hypothetical protein
MHSRKKRETMGKSFAGCMKETFKLENQSMMEFLKELKELTPEDKQWFYERFKAEGYDCDPPSVATP